ncbi:NADH dehydrogenase alpha subcomplex subunit 8 [Atractiella rhizophila]|nr:NADH dehydrogenase alpha subcomplex subunit 8 [Atractiella rhizophila]
MSAPPRILSTPYVDPTPMPANVPHVDEVGTTSAPLKSLAFFIGQHCAPYNEDFMLCKAESTDPAHCLKEGRRVTRCTQDLISKMKASCKEVLEAHYECLERSNHTYYMCRPQEKLLNECAFEKFKFKKVIPGTPEGEVPVHERAKPMYKPHQR